MSYVGYTTMDLKAAPKMKIVLKEDSKVLDDVVVVGYGIQKKSSVTGAISQVKAEDMENRTITNAKSALQGKTAGVQVIGNTSSAWFLAHDSHTRFLFQRVVGSPLCCRRCSPERHLRH